MRIDFLPANKDVELMVEAPVPAQQCIPKWMKQMPFFDGGEPLFQDGQAINKTATACMAFLDAFTAGYVQRTWTDIHIEQTMNGPVYNYAMGPEPIQIRRKSHIEIGDDYLSYEFVWRGPYAPRLPKGYSLLVTHPYNRLDLPFQTLAGVIDADTFFHNQFGNYPFYLRNNFSGVIPAGTPMFQLLPFKRDDWQSSVPKHDADEKKRLSSVVHRNFWGYYRKHMHHVKKYR